MTTLSVAGHTFVNGQCTCGIRWCEIRNCTLSDVGKPNIAHSGTAAMYEIAGIIEAAKSEDKAIAIATGWRV